ncbi:MAG: aldehyde dehydrogenase [Paludibacteraceae bacterium]|nr:aldehyde dehydrogenase [Paludibacteraceae bacterium]
MTTEEKVTAARRFFRSGKTLDVAYRKEALRRFRESIRKNEKQLTEAIRTDLGKSASESYMCEIGLVLSEIGYTLRHIDRWARGRRMATPLTNFHSKSMIIEEPYGVVLIMSPWNYPVLLTLEPLVGAIAAGNCAVVKPSAYSPATSEVMAKIITETFPEEYVSVVTGGRAENQNLLEQRFDYIFFTGGVTVGKMVMEKAARWLTPVTLELGGKSPVIIDHTANLRLAARRIAFGKFLNCGQTCIAPDYILIEQAVHDEFVSLLKEETSKMYGDALRNDNYGKIINRKHFDRISGLINQKKVVMGGETNSDKLQIAPTILDHVTPDDAVMQEEIFGPLMPILTVENTDEAYNFVRDREKPLALYIFTSDKKTERRFLTEVSFGGGCVNDTIIHIATSNMPFGGVGNSGMGHYHGKYTFQTFSHSKAVVKKYTWLDITMRYQPYTGLKDKLVRMFLN